MKIVKDECVGCPPELGCLGGNCPNKNATVIICDVCNNEEAEYNINDFDYCKQCAEDYAKEVFNEFNLIEKLDLLGILYSFSN